MLGVGAMVSELGGNEDSVKAFKLAVDKTIAQIHVKDEAVEFTFTDGTRLDLYDDGQSCCESRYLRTDDDLGAYIGAKLLGAEVSEVTEKGGDEVHEMAFLKVKTSTGVFTVVAHNEHNGYYGGFSIRARAPSPTP